MSICLTVMSISETSWKLFDVLSFLIYVHFPLFYFVKEKAVENIIWLEILWRAIMCNMCAFMHDGGYICDKRWQMYEETFWFLSKLHVFLQTKTQAIVNHQKTWHVLTFLIWIISTFDCKNKVQNVFWHYALQNCLFYHLFGFEAIVFCTPVCASNV